MHVPSALSFVQEKPRGRFQTLICIKSGMFPSVAETGPICHYIYERKRATARNKYSAEFVASGRCIDDTRPDIKLNAARVSEFYVISSARVRESICIYIGFARRLHFAFCILGY